MPELPNDIPIATASDPELVDCPHCSAKARLLPDERFRWVCGACGGARVPVSDPRTHSTAEKEHLLRSTKLLTEARLIRVGASFTAMGATGVGLLALLFLFAIHVGAVVPIVLIGASVFLSLLTISFGNAARKRIDDAKAAVSSAWELVAEALLKIHGRAVTAAELGTMMRTTEADAERLLTLLSVDDRVQSQVTDEAQIRYALPTQLRVEDPANPKTEVAEQAEQEEALALDEKIATRAETK